MNNIFNDKYKLLFLEKICYFLFIYASFIFLIATNEMKEYYDKNIKPNHKIRNKFIYASIIILIVFILFMLRNINKFQKLKKDDIEYQNALIRLVGSIFIVIGQIMVVYYFYETTTFE